MTNSYLSAPVSRREFYFEMLAVWLVILMVATRTVGPNATWRDMLVPVGALAMLALHAAALWRAQRRERATRPPAA